MATTKVIKDLTEFNPGNPDYVLNATNAVTVINAGGNQYNFNGVYGKFGLRIGTTVLTGVPSGHPIAIINNGKTSQISYTGTSSAGTATGPDGNTYTFYYGDITITVAADFGTVSYYCQIHGYMGGQDNLVSVYSEAGLRMPKGGAFSGTPAEGMMRNDNTQDSNGSISTMQHYNGTEWKNFVNTPACTTATCNYPVTATALYQLNTDTNDTCGSNNGTNNNVTFNTSIKKYGAASAEFNGTNADIDLPAGINGATMSVSFWIYIDATVSSDQVVFELQGTGGGGANQDGYGVFFTAGGGGKLYMQTLNSNSNHTRSNVAIPASQWVHVAAVWNSGSRTFYIDTVAQTTGGTQVTYLTMNANTVGSRGTGEFFDGYIDQARIFPSALTQAQVTDLYNEIGC